MLQLKRKLKPLHALFTLGLGLGLGLLPSALAEKMGAVLNTTKGKIVWEFYDQEAPKTVAHIKALIESGFYNQGMRFHRIVPGFVVQTGDPTNTGAGGAGKTIALEVDNQLSHTAAGIVAMARSQELDSASSQFYITLDSAKSLDAKYAIFARVIQGMDVLPRLETTDRLYSITLTDIEALAVEPEAPEQEHPFWSIFKAGQAD